MRFLALTVLLGALAAAPSPPFGGIPGGARAPGAKPERARPPGDAPPSSLPCSGGKTVASVPLYDAGVEVGWEETVRGRLVRHVGYPAGWAPDIVYGIRSPASGKWTLFGWYLLKRIPAGICIESFGAGPCPAPGLETRHLCGKDFAGKPVDRWPGKPEVNAFKIYHRGLSGRRNPAFNEDGTAKMIALDPELRRAWQAWSAIHPAR